VDSACLSRDRSHKPGLQATDTEVPGYLHHATAPGPGQWRTRIGISRVHRSCFFAARTVGTYLRPCLPLHAPVTRNPGHSSSSSSLLHFRVTPFSIVALGVSRVLLPVHRNGVKPSRPPFFLVHRLLAPLLGCRSRGTTPRPSLAHTLAQVPRQHSTIRPTTSRTTLWKAIHTPPAPRSLWLPSSSTPCVIASLDRPDTTPILHCLPAHRHGHVPTGTRISV
jgi:hypothetical protein